MARIFPPPREAIANGTKLVSRISLKSSGPRRIGAVHDENGKVRWSYAPHPPHEPWSFANPLRKPDLVFLEEDKTEAFRIRRISLFPSIFEALEQGKTIATIRLTSILRNQYEIHIAGFNTWTFRMPLYRAHFYGKSSAGPEIWVAMAHEAQWRILLHPGLPERPLSAILAFIHNERFFYS